MKKKILLVSPLELSVSGVPAVLMTIVKELHSEYDFDIVTLCDKSGYYDDEIKKYGVNIYKIKSISYVNHKILYPLSFFQIYKGITKLLKENKYDIIHCHSGWQDAACHLAARHMGVLVRISHGHGTYVWSGRNLIMRSYFNIAKKILCKYATVRLACSKNSGDSLYNGMDYENIVNPVDISQYKEIERISHEGINLLQIGYFCKLKNQIFSLQLLSELRERKIEAHLSFIGYRHPNEPDYPEKMNEAIKQYGLEEFVSILPHDHDKRSAFAEADYSLLPSESEGLPLVALESQAAGIVCLMSDNISEESSVGAGFFLPHNDVKKWADAIVEGFNVDKDRLSRNLLNISTETYIEKIKAHYESTAESKKS